ncbi:MAG: hypothetical protein ACI910_003279 [Oleispira sp.]|jgi:hypothetical protein
MISILSFLYFSDSACSDGISNRQGAQKVAQKFNEICFPLYSESLIYFLVTPGREKPGTKIGGSSGNFS